ncbi:MAG: VWA domain-containing protein [Deltaproteobacteria bacterium]|nr:VWA domain-containing protein [Deltaproteobacteria bacterium]
MDHPSFAYVLADPAALGIGVRQPVVLLWLLLTPLFFYFPHRAGRLVAGLRSAAFVAAVLAFAGLELTTSMPSQRRTVVAALDVSPSIDDGGREWARRYVDTLQAQLAPTDELAVITFGGDVHLLRPPGAPAPLGATPAGSAAAVTDLGAAIDSAMGLLPADGERRIVLLTDGNQTRGDSRRRLAWLRTAGVRVDAAVPPHANAPDVRVVRILAPVLIGSERVTPVRVIADNGGDLRTAVLNLYLDDAMADSAAVELPPGRSALTLPTQLVGEGGRRLRAELVLRDDPQPANNQGEVGVTVRGPSRALLLTSRKQSPVARALTRKGVRVDVQPPSTLHGIETLRPYHLVVLEDVTAAELGSGALAALERWVRDHGGGLVVAGGGNTFGDSGFANTPLKRLLPVTLEPRRPAPNTREPLAIFLVVDRSNSMAYNSRIGTRRDGEKMRYAKEAALAVVRQLKDQDAVGLVVFDSQPHEVAPLKPLRENRRELETLIPRLVENGGTDFYDALEMARRQLASSRVTRRHVMLITDGDTNRAGVDEYRSLTSALAADHITVTTVRIGDNTVNLKLLQDISRQTGGEFHYVENAAALPDLMLRETTRALTPQGPSTETYFPHLAEDSPLLHGIGGDALPPLSGYAFAKPKPEADVLLRVTRMDRGDPLLAVWHVGLGRVAAFTASPGDDAEAWVGWPEFSKFWSQVAHWAAREQGDDDVAVEAQRDAGVTTLNVRSFGPTADDATLSARLTLKDGTTRDVPLVPRQPRLFSASLLDVPPGRYPVTVTKRGAGGDVAQTAQTVTIPATDSAADAEFARTAPDRGLLAQLTGATGGTLDAAPAALTARVIGERRVGYPLDALLLPLAMLLFLADTVLRLRQHG